MTFLHLQILLITGNIQCHCLDAFAFFEACEGKPFAVLARHCGCRADQTHMGQWVYWLTKHPQKRNVSNYQNMIWKSEILYSVHIWNGPKTSQNHIRIGQSSDRDRLMNIWFLTVYLFENYVPSIFVLCVILCASLDAVCIRIFRSSATDPVFFCPARCAPRRRFWGKKWNIWFHWASSPKTNIATTYNHYNLYDMFFNADSTCTV